MTTSHEAANAIGVADSPVLSATGLEQVIETLDNGVRGYRTVAHKLEDEGLGALMSALADRRQEVRDRLVQVVVEQHPGFAVDDGDGTVPGALHRAWIALEGAVAGDAALLDTAKNGEQHALEQVKDAQSGQAGPVLSALQDAEASIEAAIANLENYRPE